MAASREPEFRWPAASAYARIDADGDLEVWRSTEEHRAARGCRR
jgi:hypothetical protein